MPQTNNILSQSLELVAPHFYDEKITPKNLAVVIHQILLGTSKTFTNSSLVPHYVENRTHSHKYERSLLLFLAKNSSDLCLTLQFTPTLLLQNFTSNEVNEELLPALVNGTKYFAKSLRTFSVGGVGDDETLEKYLSKCIHLETLYLQSSLFTNFYDDTDDRCVFDCLQPIAPSLRYLQYTTMDNQLLHAAGKLFKNLTSLELNRCNTITSSALATALDHSFENIETVSLWYFGKTPSEQKQPEDFGKVLETLCNKHSGTLKSLSLTCQYLPFEADKVLPSLKNVPNLRKLHLGHPSSSSNTLTDSILKQLACAETSQITGLADIDFAFNDNPGKLTKEGFTAFFKRFKFSLEKINVAGCTGAIEDSCFACYDEEQKEETRKMVPPLRELSVSNNNKLTGRTFYFLSSLTKLEVITANGCDGIDDDIFSALALSPSIASSLKKLEMKSCDKISGGALCRYFTADRMKSLNSLNFAKNLDFKKRTHGKILKAAFPGISLELYGGVYASSSSSDDDSDAVAYGYGDSSDGYDYYDSDSDSDSD